MANGTFLDIPGEVVVAATAIIGVFLGAACYLYQWNFGVPATANSAYWLKVADAFINGAIVGVFFAMLRTIFELPKLSRWILNSFGFRSQT